MVSMAVILVMCINLNLCTNDEHHVLLLRKDLPLAKSSVLFVSRFKIH